MRAVPVLLALAFLAGCSAPAAPPEAPSESVTTITDPGDFSGDAGGAHFHDYWHDERQVIVLDAFHPGGTAEGAGPGLAGGQSVPVMEFRPESGSVVPQGAASVEVTLTWTDAAGDSYLAPELWVKTAGMNASSLVSAIASGQTVGVPSTNLDNDLPHQLLSAWVFELRMTSPDPFPLRFKGSVEAVAVAVRGLDIPLYPAHPDRWQGQEVLPLLKGDGTLSYFEDPVDHGCNGQSCPQVFVPDDGAIVPFDAARVEVVLDATGTQGVDLHYHGGGSRDFTEAVPVRTEGTQRFYELAIDGADGPYALQSQWEFTVLPATAEPVAAGFESSYAFTVTVHKR